MDNHTLHGSAFNVNRFGQSACELPTAVLRGQRRTADNSTFAIGGVSCSADSFVVIESAALKMNICAEKPAHRKSATRYRQC